MKIGDYIILEKIKDKKYNNFFHPNGVNTGSREIQGYVKKLPIIGEQFYLFPNTKINEPCSWTSKIVKFSNKQIETENSIYKIYQKDSI